jgi:two-component system, response regulator PdtaR
MNGRIVLVVEDDPFVRMDAVDMIVDSGFQTLEADNADDAIEILEQRSDICVVFTDVQMPGTMDGLKLAAAIHDRWPPIKIIATSGQFTVLEQQLPQGGRFIPKPYSRNGVGALLEEVLAS